MLIRTHIRPTFVRVSLVRMATGFVACVLIFSPLGLAFENNQTRVAGDPRQIVKAADKLILKGNLIEAERILRAGLVETPADVNLKLKLAFALMKMRVLGEAYTLSFEVAKANNENSQAFAVLGAVLLTAGRFNDARSILSQSLRLNRANSLALATFGLLEFYENRINLSLDYLAEANFQDTDNPDFIFSYAQVAARSERYKEAANAYKKFLIYSRDADDDRRARIRGLINFLEYLGAVTSLYSISGTSTSTVPIELRGNRPVITLRVNGKPNPLRFVLDTGSGISVISNETAKRLRIRTVARGGHAKGIGGDGKFEIVYGFLRDVSIGDMKIRNVPVYIREFHQNVHGIDGYIGISLISKFLTTVDYGSREFTLARFDGQPTADPAGKDLSLPLRLTSSGFLSGEVVMEGMTEPLNFIVDTGASVSVVAETVARREPISLLPRSEKLRVIGSAGITENVDAFILPKISFGEHSREQVTAIALDLEIINDASGFEQSGILGGNFFLNFKMTFDFRNSRLLFAPAKPVPAEITPQPNEIKSLY